MWLRNERQNAYNSNLHGWYICLANKCLADFVRHSQRQPPHTCSLCESKQNRWHNLSIKCRYMHYVLSIDLSNIFAIWRLEKSLITHHSSHHWWVISYSKCCWMTLHSIQCNTQHSRMQMIFYLTVYASVTILKIELNLTFCQIYCLEVFSRTKSSICTCNVTKYVNINSTRWQR